MATQGTGRTQQTLLDNIGTLGQPAQQNLIDLTQSLGGSLASSASDGVVLFGDSITANNGGYGARDASLNVITDPSIRGWWWYANGINLRGGLKLLANLGISGSTVLDYSGDGRTLNPMVSRYQTIFGYSPKYVFFMGGINDLAASYAGGNAEAVMNGIVTICDAIRARGIQLIMQTVLPKFSGSVTQTYRNQMARVVALNNYIRRYCAQRRDVWLFDAAALFSDPASTDFIAKSGWLDATDNLHPSALGAKEWGQALSVFLGSRIPTTALDKRPTTQSEYILSARAVTASSLVRANGVATFTGNTNMSPVVGQTMGVFGATPADLNGWRQVTSVIDTSTFQYLAPGSDGAATGTIRCTELNQIQPNPLILTTTGGTLNTCTGTAPGNTTHAVTGSAAAVIGSAARTVAVDGDALGNNITAVVTSGANNDTYKVTMTLALFGFRPGDRLRFVHGVRLSNVSALSQWISNLSYQFDGVSGATYALNSSGVAQNMFTSDLPEMVLQTPDLIVPSFTTVNFLNWQMQFTFNGAGGLTMNVGRCGLYVISPNHLDY